MGFTMNGQHLSLAHVVPTGATSLLRMDPITTLRPQAGLFI